MNAAAILNAASTDLKAEMLEALNEADKALGEKVKEKMFVFDNLMALDDCDFQRLIREIAQENLVTALKGVDQALADRFFNKMSERAAEILQEDMASKGPVKRVEVEAAQKEILQTAQKLSEQGEIQLGKGSDDCV